LAKASKHIIVIGGGAAGFFAAINSAENGPSCKITLLEKTTKLLSKVKVSGGGRCNVTHSCFDNSELVKNYPRGNKELLQVFSRFSVKDTIEWFEKHGVKLKTEEDGRMFPVSDNSQTIIDLFLSLCKKYKIEIITSCEVFGIKHIGDRSTSHFERSREASDDMTTRTSTPPNQVRGKLLGLTSTSFILKTSQGEMKADKIICALGGHPKSGAYDVLKNLGHKIIDPIPSLFTINLPSNDIKKELQGIAVKNAEVKIGETKLNYSGPVLITHWGLSGPAVLKLSAFAAKTFFEKDYNSEIILNWVFPMNQEECNSKILQLKNSKNNSLPHSNPLFDLPKRLWEYLCKEAGISKEKVWAEIPNKNIIRLSEILCRSVYQMKGKTTFKEEFVTCGGIDLKEIDVKTMQSKIVPGLFFCGEVLNIDGITGGFNFQSAWSTAFVCSLLDYSSERSEFYS
jgi:predicted flavoprotein YhiN